MPTCGVTLGPGSCVGRPQEERGGRRETSPAGTAMQVLRGHLV